MQPADPSRPALPRGRTDAGAGWLLLSFAVALPWLLPPRGQPWPDFWNQWLATLPAIALAAWAAVQAPRTAWKLPPAALAFVVLALVVGLQALTGVLPRAGEAVLPALYALGVAACIAVAGRVEAAAPGRLPEALLAGVFIAALVSTGLALAQWLKIDDLGLLFHAQAPGMRPVANLGQPNNLATLLLWGVVALWWGWLTRRIGTLIALLALGFLGFGLLLTQSRSGMLGLLVLAAFAVFAPGPRRPSRRLVALLVLAFAATVVAWGSAGEAVGLEAARTASETLQAGKRPAIWALSLEAIALRPGLGWGVGLNVLAQGELIGAREPLFVNVAHAHNLVLDLAVWVGLPLAVLLLAGACWWAVRRWRAARQSAADGRAWVLLALLAVLVLHAMLELPHVYAQFLVPAALVIGVLDAGVASPTMRIPGRVAAPAGLAALAAACAVVALDYKAVSDDLMAWRLRVARIGELTPPPPPQVRLLGGLQHALVAVRVEPRPAMPSSEIADLEWAARRYPAAGTLFKLAQAHALNGRPGQAAWAWQYLCAVHPPAQCAAAAAAWRELAASRWPQMSAVAPPR